ncbi:MAG TPA: hypothetical protein VFE25_16520 [Opitutaceae bacterium]|nr:hypothetical protein [Opitutaceae bacterium]
MASLLAFTLALPSIGMSCACGCGIFQVGTSSMLPTGAGGVASVDFDYQDQDRNWSGDARAPAADNPDRDIRTSVVSLAVQEVFNPDWSARIDLPFERRHFETTGGATGDDVVSLDFSGVGDVRLQGIYTGLSPGFVTGLTFGVKLPTGSVSRNDAYGDIDRDTELGSGSTDILLGVFRRLDIGSNPDWSGFAQVVVDAPVVTRDGYRPGTELDASFGVYYSGFTLHGVLISPALQLKGSVRGSDGGPNASEPVASGFERILVVPGVEFSRGRVRLDADIGLPAYQRFTGEQLAAPALFRLSVSYAY